MRYQSLDQLPGNTEPVITQISIPCTETQKRRYRDLSNRLDDLRSAQQSPKISKKVLPACARHALDEVMDQIERLLLEAAS